jgi:hypothetical protein
LTGYQTPEEQAADLQNEQAQQKQKAQDAAKHILKTGMAFDGDAKAVGDLPWEEGMAFTKQIKEKADKEKQRGWVRNNTYEKHL